MLARGTLDALGLHDVPVGIGTDGGNPDGIDDFTKTSKSYLPDASVDMRARCSARGGRADWSARSRELRGISTCEAGNYALRNFSASAPARQRATPMKRCSTALHTVRIATRGGSMPAAAVSLHLSLATPDSARAPAKRNGIAAAAPIPGIPAAAEFRALQLRLDPRSFAHTALCAPRLAAPGMSGVCSCE